MSDPDTAPDSTAMPPAEAAARLRREAQFHDDRFARDTRTATDRFYAVTGQSFDWYRARTVDCVAGLRALEYGCGLGSAALDIARAGGHATGIDISPVAIELAQRQAAEAGLAERTAFRVMNAERLEWPDASFDRVCGSGILHHLDLARALPEVARVLVAGGCAVFLEPLGHNPAINLYRRLTPRMRTADEHPLTMRDLALAQRHFAAVEIRFFHLAALAAVAVQGTPLFRPALALLSATDRLLLARRSPLRRWAWIAVIEMHKAGPPAPAVHSQRTAPLGSSMR